MRAPSRLLYYESLLPVCGVKHVGLSRATKTTFGGQQQQFRPPFQAAVTRNGSENYTKEGFFARHVAISHSEGATQLWHEQALRCGGAKRLQNLSSRHGKNRFTILARARFALVALAADHHLHTRMPPLRRALACLLVLGTASALRTGARPLRRSALPLRAHLVLNTEPDDTLVCYGDALICLVYGSVQYAIDNALTPLAVASPDLFTIAEPLPAPLLQGTVLAAAWVLACKALGGYQTEVTRSRGAPVVTSCLKTWALSSAAVLGAAWLLQSQLGLGPGLRNDEIGFVTGSLTVVGGWRFVVAALPY